MPGNRFHLFLVGNDSVWVRPDQKVRLWALDVDGKTVTILAGAPAATFDTVMTERLEPIIDSLHFGELPAPTGT